ncbi:flavin reductase family protein [Nonomuraea sp. NPDC004297]
MTVPADGAAAGGTGRRFRDVLGRFMTGVAIVTVRDGEAGHASTVNSLTSVSLDPALLLICLRRGGTTARLIRRTGAFGLSILASDQAWMARRFSDCRRPAGLAGLSYRQGGTTGVPILNGVPAWCECTVERVVEGGDHDVVFGAVNDLAVAGDQPPLAFFRGRYGRFEPVPPHEEMDINGVQRRAETASNGPGVH